MSGDIVERLRALAMSDFNLMTSKAKRLRARVSLQAEVDQLRAEIERLRSQVITLEAEKADNTALIDRLWRERDRAQAKVERARVTLREIMLISRGVCGELESGRDSSLMGAKP